MSEANYTLLAPISTGDVLSRFHATDERGEPVEVRRLDLSDLDALQRESIRKWVATAFLVDAPSVRSIRAAHLDADPPSWSVEPLDSASLVSDWNSQERSPTEAVHVATHLAGALVAARTVGFAHGALSPAHVVQRDDGQWAWDLSLASFAPSHANPIGAPFRAPEAAEPFAAETASDVFSLAGILQWMLSLAANGQPSTLDHCEAADANETMQTLPPIANNIATLIEEALDPDPNLRPNAVDFLARLTPNPTRGPDQSQPIAADVTMAANVEPVAPFSPPTKIGRYRIAEKLGEGGMGAVYRGEDMADGASVAVKILSNPTAVDAASQRRFGKEARMLAKIQSPYVANLLEFNDDEGLHFLAIEFVPGGTLAQVLKRLGRLEQDLAMAVIVDVARGLALAHRMGVVHRDIKPENILLTKDGARLAATTNAARESGKTPLAKLTDFGLARSVDQSESLAITKDGAVMGTPFYMAPEQCRGEATDARTDVYSLGATLFHLLTGRPPYEADTTVGVLNKHCHDPIPSLLKERPEATPALDQVIQKTLAKNPDARFDNADDLLVELENLVHGRATSLAVHPAIPDHDPEKSLTYEFSWPLTSSPAQLWPFVANTDRLNQAIGLPSVRFTTRKDPVLGTRRFAETRIAGQKIAWEEHPFEWIEGRRMSVLREFSQGPFAWFVNVVELIPQADGSTLLSHSVTIEPRNVLGRLIATLEIGAKAKRSLSRVYHQIDGFIAADKHRDPTADPFHKPAELGRRRRDRLHERLDSLRDSGVDALVIDTLGRFLENGSDQEVARLRPRAFAERFGLNADDVVSACLHATQHGILVLLWDILCPTCRIPSNVQESLAALDGHEHCEACDIDFELDFGRSIEMIFRSDPEIRDVDVHTYCIGGPSFSSHVVSQVRLQPGERFEMELSLSEGEYCVRGPQLPFTVELRVRANGALSRCDISLSNGSQPPPSLKSGSQVLNLVNDGEAEVIARLERSAPRSDAFTAADASSLPLFRELLPGQVLSAQQTVSIASVTLLRIELDQAAELYEQLGDGAAFDAIREALIMLERCITSKGGVVVKIIGEGLAASFNSPQSAIESALLSFDSITELETDLTLRLRAAVHRGPAMVTTLNDRLDYFGTTVHLTDRLLQLARHGDLVATNAVVNNREIGRLLEDRAKSAEVIGGREGVDVIVQRFTCG